MARVLASSAVASPSSTSARAFLEAASVGKSNNDYDGR